MRYLAVLLSAVGLLASPAAAFNLERVKDTNGKWYPVRWAPGTRTIRFQVNDRPLQLLPNLAADTMVLPTIEAAMQAWAFAPISLQVDKMTTRTSWAYDGTNVISFADTPQNRDVSANNLGATLRWWSRGSKDSYWRISEVDIVLHPGEKFGANGQKDRYDLQGIMTHELGHSLGLSHSPVASATMWASNEHGETRARVVDPDDVNAVTAIYGDLQNPQLGVVTGKVLGKTDSPIFGAHVVAADAAGIVRGSAFAERDGSFTLPLLPPGSYTMHVEPINKIHTTGEFSYDYYHDARRDFHATFVGGNEPRSISLSAGQTVALDPIHVETRQPGLDIEFLDWSIGGAEYSNLGARAATVAPGSYVSLVILGHGLNQDTQVRSSSSDVTFYTNSMSVRPWSQGFTALYLPMSVRASAAPGGRNLYVSRDGEIAAFTGGIKVMKP